MIIISFPVQKVNFSHDYETFTNLGFKIIDNGPEGCYLKLPVGWLGTYQYHTSSQFVIEIKDNNRKVRAYATLVGNTANVELLNRYNVVNYKPWLSPSNSELRLIDTETGRIIFSQNYLPKLVPNNNSTDLILSESKSTVDDFDTAYKNMLDFCKANNIDLVADFSLLK